MTIAENVHEHEIEKLGSLADRRWWDPSRRIRDPCMP
jgi:hypothetical protein